jgi:hypothetical protein
MSRRDFTGNKNGARKAAWLFRQEVVCCKKKIEIIDESHEIVDESHGQPDLEQFSGLVRDFLLVSRAVFRLIASKNSGMTALPHAKETER